MPAPPIPTAAKIYALLCFVLALLGVFGFGAAKSPAMFGWLIFWIAISLAAGVAILRRDKSAATVVWIFTAMSGLSALARLRGIDVVLFALQVWFAVWYQKRRRLDSVSEPPTKLSP